ncbi:flagellar assembly factor FliW [Spirochaetia bacterium]|nr:flagellar assembly factor FliW [Spirochaetia bacterium]
MKVATKAYGLIDVDMRQRLFFPQGLFGFESLKDYILLDAEQQPYYWLQSMESAATAFILISPFLFRPDYVLDINDAELAEIGISSPEAALIFSIVTVPADDSAVTANLQGPIVINTETRMAKQIILGDTKWKTKHDIMQELASVKPDLKPEFADLSADGSPC